MGSESAGLGTRLPGVLASLLGRPGHCEQSRYGRARLADHLRLLAITPSALALAVLWRCDQPRTPDACPADDPRCRRCGGGRVAVGRAARGAFAGPGRGGNRRGFDDARRLGACRPIASPPAGRPGLPIPFSPYPIRSWPGGPLQVVATTAQAALGALVPVVAVDLSLWSHRLLRVPLG